MVDISVFSIVIAATSVTVAAIFAVFQLRNLVKARKMDLILRLYLNWGEVEMKKSYSRLLAVEISTYEDFVKRFGNYASPDHAQIWTDIDRICWFVNGYSYLIYKGLANKKDVVELLGHGLVPMWEKLRPVVYGLRKDINSPQSWQWFEYMYNELKKET